MRTAKKWLRVTAVLLVLLLAGCGAALPEEAFLGESIENTAFFPAPYDTFVGDPMPFYDNGKFNVFFLDDLRDGQKGYHPWSLYTTEDFYHYEYHKEVIPFAASAEEQDIALGTGSVIKAADGVYHAYYTGHNDMLRLGKSKEAVMHATSTDLINWTKLPEDTFDGAESYSADDFRDPYVLYNENEQRYWMLVATRKNNTGVIAKYVSADLKNWEDAGVFFTNDMGTDSNLECPSLVRFGEKYYLFFSDQWPQRVVHYRVGNLPDGPFDIPKKDTFDGNGFYAGRAETDGENLYLVGWNATKDHYRDEGDYVWAGSLVVHQLLAEQDGSLQPAPVASLTQALNHKLAFKAVETSKTVRTQKDGIAFSGSADGAELARFKPLSGSYCITGTIALEDTENTGRFGFTFDADDAGDGALGELNLVFDAAQNTLAFYNTAQIDEATPQTKIEFDFGGKKDISFTLLISDSVVSLYVDKACVLTARMYNLQENAWGIFSIDSKMSVKALEISK